VSLTRSTRAECREHLQALRDSIERLPVTGLNELGVVFVPLESLACGIEIVAVAEDGSGNSHREAQSRQVVT
jgi:hypothetical protein